MHNWWNTYIKSLPKDIVYLLLADLLFLLVMEMVLRRIPAPFPFLIKIGDLMITLGISFLASFIFYFVQVHLPEVKQKACIYPTIAIFYYRIIVAEKDLLMNFINIDQFINISEEDIKKGFTKRNVALYDAPLFLIDKQRNANWMEYGTNKVEVIEKNLEKIMQYSLYLDSNFMSILARIQNDGLLNYFRVMKPLYPYSKIGKMNGMEKPFIDFWHFIIEQDVYYHKVFAPFRV